MADHVVQPNVFSYSACISAYEKMGRWKEPLELPLGFFYGLHKVSDTVDWKGCLFCVGVDFLRNDVNGKENKASLQELDLGCST